MELITYHCEALDAGGIWRTSAMAPPEGVKLPPQDQLDAKACIEHWDPSGQLKWRIVRTVVTTTITPVPTINRQAPTRAGRTV